MDAAALTRQTFEDLGLSESFVRVSHEMGLYNIAEILAEKPEALRERKGFNYKWLGELTRLLSANNMLYLLQPPPGKNPG